MSEEIKVLVPTIGCTTAISTVKGLKLSKDKKYRIIGTDICDRYEVAGAVFLDAYYKVPFIEQCNYLDVLFEIAKKESIDVIVPILDSDVEKLSKSRKVFEGANIKICAPSFEIVCICNDKYKTYTYLKEKNIEMPPVYLKEEALKKEFSIKYPAFVKPRNGISSVDCYKVNNENELSVFLSRINDPIVQGFMEGQKCVVDIVNDMNGKNIIAIPRYEYSSKAGVGVKAEVVKDDLLIKFSSRLSEVVGITGVANIEVYKKNNKLLLVEINPRFSAGVVLSIIAGVNIPEIVIDLFLNNHIDFSKLSWEEGIYMTRYWQECFSFDRSIPKYVNYFK